MQVEVLKSQEDASVNFVFKGDFPGYFEARYVRRSPEYFVVYLSSQSACIQACRFCHLTASKQTTLINATKEHIICQADTVLSYYDNLNLPANRIHFSFMSRGEMLVNPNLTKLNDYSILESLGTRALSRNLFPRFTVSTILPKDIPNKDLTKLFPLIYPDIYYSIYSMNSSFRKKWLPNALAAEEGLDILMEYQIKTKKILKLHWAFIKNENDDEQTLENICKAVKSRQLRVDINIVRYNPFSTALGEEPSQEILIRNYNYLREAMPVETLIKIVDRVGHDVKGSCGMFVEKT